MSRIVVANVRLWLHVDDINTSTNNVNDALSEHLWELGKDIDGVRVESVLYIELEDHA